MRNCGRRFFRSGKETEKNLGFLIQDPNSLAPWERVRVRENRRRRENSS
jgi:hypothetical protein